MLMAFIYEGVNVDVATPGYTSSSTAVTIANNIIGIVNRRLAEIDRIVASYQAAHTPYAAAIAYGNTLNIRSTDPSVRSALIANQIQLSKLQPEVAKWGKIVVANGGKFASGTVGNTGSSLDATPDFTDKRSKYNADLAKYTKVLQAAGPEICTGLPPFDATLNALVNEARVTNDALLASAESTANRENAYQIGLATESNPNTGGNLSPEAKLELINQGIAAGTLVWTTITLGLLADTMPDGKWLGNSELSSLAKKLKKGASLQEARDLLSKAALTSKGKTVVANSPPSKNKPPKPAPAPKPAKTKPPKPVPPNRPARTKPPKPAK